MVAAVVLRLAALWPSAYSGSLLHATATAWIIALGLYLYRYIPILIRPRADAAPKAGVPRPGVQPPGAAGQRRTGAYRHAFNRYDRLFHAPADVPRQAHGPALHHQ